MALVRLFFLTCLVPKSSELLAGGLLGGVCYRILGLCAIAWWVFFGCFILGGSRNGRYLVFGIEPLFKMDNGV